ncbi:hypothetical protein [Nostoc sp.]
MKAEVATLKAEAATDCAKHGNVKAEVATLKAEVATDCAKHGNVKTEAATDCAKHENVKAEVATLKAKQLRVSPNDIKNSTHKGMGKKLPDILHQFQQPPQNEF